MRSIPLAMTWEMLQRGRWYLIAYFLGAQLIISVVFGALARAGVDFEDPSMVGVGASFLLTYMFLFSVSALAYQGPPSRLYTYPVSSLTIVSGHLLVSMASVGLQILLSIFLMNICFKTNWPLWGPVLFAAAAVCSIQATTWFTEKSAWAPLAVVVVSLSMWSGSWKWSFDGSLDIGDSGGSWWFSCCHGGLFRCGKYCDDSQSMW